MKAVNEDNFNLKIENSVEDDKDENTQLNESKEYKPDGNDESEDSEIEGSADEEDQVLSNEDDEDDRNNDQSDNNENDDDEEEEEGEEYIDIENDFPANEVVENTENDDIDGSQQLYDASKRPIVWYSL